MQWLVGIYLTAPNSSTRYYMYNYWPRAHDISILVAFPWLAINSTMGEVREHDGWSTPPPNSDPFISVSGKLTPACRDHLSSPPSPAHNHLNAVWGHHKPSVETSGCKSVVF